MIKKEDDFKKKLLLTIFLGYSGIDKFILKKTEKGIKRFFLFIVSIFSIYFSQKILKIIYLLTQKAIFSTRGFFETFSSSVFLLKHMPKVTGLFCITILIFAFLILLFSAYILWIDDIIAVIKREDF